MILGFTVYSLCHVSQRVMSDTATKKPTKDASPKLAVTQRALEFIHPMASEEMQGFRWTKNPEGGAHVEFDLGQDCPMEAIQEEPSVTTPSRKYVFTQ
jgi:hypothetical protein